MSNEEEMQKERKYMTESSHDCSCDYTVELTLFNLFISSSVKLIQLVHFQYFQNKRALN